MATERQKPSDDLNQSVENPKETLNLTAAKADEAPSASVSGSDDPKTIAPSAEAVSDIGRKMRRAERFGISVQLTEQEKRTSRAERFGTGSGHGTTIPSSVSGSCPGSGSGTELSKKAEELKRKARAERFSATSPPVASEEDTKKKARLARFAPAAKVDPLEEDKRRARALRFANNQSNSVSDANGKGNVKPQAAAIAGKAGGGA